MGSYADAGTGRFDDSGKSSDLPVDVSEAGCFSSKTAANNALAALKTMQTENDGFDSSYLGYSTVTMKVK